MRTRVLAGFAIALLALSLSVAAAAQSESATISGKVTDKTGAALPNADVLVTNVDTNVSVSSKTNSVGIYVVPTLKPGHYRVTISKDGFQTTTLSNVVLNVQDQFSRNFELQVGARSETVNVVADAATVNTTDASVSTIINRNLVDNMPLNGRSFNVLVQLTPGVVTMPVGENTRGQYAVNGQRVDANYYTIDGVSANLGVGSSQATGQGGSGSSPATSALGGTNNQVSLDALQEFRIYTSTYAPEFGRSPGGQISVASRSGTNAYHGAVFDYLRNDVFDANDWFGNRSGLPKTASRQNDFGGIFGGALFPNRTFFFASYEGLQLRQPVTLNTQVPSLTFRNIAPAALQPYLKMFPTPTGADQVVAATGRPTGYAPAVASLSNPSVLNATSIKIDHNLGKGLQLFGRWNYAPSNGDARGPGINTVTRFNSNLQTITGGLVVPIGHSMTNDFRMNWSHAEGNRNSFIDTTGGGVPLADSVLFPPGFDSTNSIFTFRISTASTASVSTGVLARNLSQQFNLVDGFSWVKGAHQLKFGADWRWIDTNLKNALMQNITMFADTGFSATFPGTGTPAANTVLAATGMNLFSRNIPADIIFNSWSLYAQDTWKATNRLTFTYGIRWDVNAAPQSDGNPLITLNSFTDPHTITPAPAGSPFYNTRYGAFAPRVGMAYQVSQDPRYSTVIRAGFGEFYDTAYGIVMNILGRPFNGVASANVVPQPLPLNTPLPAPAITAPFSNFNGVDPNLELPRTWQWNVAVEQQLGAAQSLTTTYVGAAGRKLFTQELFSPALDASFIGQTILGDNNSFSNYNALQAQFNRRLSHGLQGIASYTWSHSLDNASNDSVAVIHVPNFTDRLNYGNSDFDVRQNFTAAGVYEIPTPHFGGAVGRAILGNWGVDPIFRYNTARPVDITSARSVVSIGSYTSRVDVVAGQPFYITDPTVPGGRRFNPAAFVVEPNTPAGLFSQGNFGRNVLRGPSFTQFDTSVHRDFKVTERIQVQFRTDFFNLFNHPNFGNPSSTYSTSATVFGVPTNMLGKSLNAAPGGGFNALYQIGGPRSIQFSMRIGF